MKVVDTFMFCNELDMLEGRLKYLYDHVDYFVLVEAPLTQSGDPKPMHFLNNKSRYKEYLDKIIYFPFLCKRSDFDFERLPTHDRDYDTGPWRMENAQRDHITKSLDLFSDDSVIFISDCDEIYHKDCIPIAKDYFNKGYEALSVEVDHFSYSFAQKQKSKLLCSTVSTNAFTKKHGAAMVHNCRYSYGVISNGGWHLSWWGDTKMIQYKIQTFAHQEFNQEKYKDPEYITKQIQEGVDLFGRDPSIFGYVKVDPSEIPADVYSIFNGIKQKIDNL